MRPACASPEGPRLAPPATIGIVDTAERRSVGPSDLHMHSDHSDGTGPPAEVIRAAHTVGLRTVALTDHDTTTGWAEAAREASALGMTFIPGMELSAREDWRSVHVLAYLCDADDPALKALTDRIRSSRLSRAQVMAERIGHDFDLTWEDILAHTATGASVGRPHIADALVAKGYARDRGDAFSGILHPREKYYVPLYAPDAVAAVAAIVGAGGVPIIAHPAGRTGLLPRHTLNEMLDAGLAGFELGHRENLPGPVATLQALATEKNLIVTGSSDYHGAGKPNLPGEHTTTDEMVQRIIARATGNAPVYPEG